MSYTKQQFRSGEVLYASQLNAMDDQITANETAIETLQQSVRDLLYEAIAITAFSASPSQVEKGSTVTSVTLTYAMNKAPESATLDGNARELNASGTIALTGLSLTSGKTWTLAATDERNATASKTTALSFLNRVHWGAASVPQKINSAFLLGLSGSALASGKSKTITVNAGTGEYVWYAVPSSFGACAFNVGGFDGGFTKVSTISHTNASGHTENYDVYRSDNAALGSTTIKIS